MSKLVVYRVNPDGRPWQRPQCEASVGDFTARYRMSSGQDDRCHFKAWYEVNGAKLCHRHAGTKVLEILAPF
jgi:hypothetical protein